MVAYSFRPQFEADIVDGTKRQTVRGFRKRHARPGEPMQIYTGMRTKHCRKLLKPDPICFDLRSVLIAFNPSSHHIITAIEIDRQMLGISEAEQFAADDGFGGSGSALQRMGVFWLNAGVAAGEDHLARGLRDAFLTVRCSDVFAFGDRRGHDFLVDPADAFRPIDWIITNPPFVLGEAFIERALRIARRGTAMFVRSAFIESGGRYRALFGPECRRPDFVLQFVERVVLLKGRLIQANAPDPFNLDERGVPRKASSATSYCWLVWQNDGNGFEPIDGDTRHRWLGTPRVQLERPGDYPAYPEQWAKLAAERSDQQPLFQRSSPQEARP